jgi:chromosome segregation ATPase
MPEIDMLQSLDDALESLEGALERCAAGVFARCDFTDEKLERANARLSAIASSVPEWLEGMGHMLQQAREKAEQELTELEASVHAFCGHLTQAQSDLESVTQALERQTEGLQTLLQSVDDELDASSKALTHAGEEWVESTEHTSAASSHLLDDLQHSMALYGELVEDQGEQMHEHLNRVTTNAAQRCDDFALAANKGHEAVDVLITEHFRRFGNGTQAGLEGLLRATHSLTQAGSRLGDKFTSRCSQVTQSISGVLGALRQVEPVLKIAREMM